MVFYKSFPHLHHFILIEDILNYSRKRTDLRTEIYTTNIDISSRINTRVKFSTNLAKIYSMIAMPCAALGNNVDLFEASTSLRVFQLFIANLTLALLWFGIKIFRSLYLEPNVLCNLRSLLNRWLQTLMHFLRKDFLQNAQEQKQNGKLWRTSLSVQSYI